MIRQLAPVISLLFLLGGCMYGEERKAELIAQLKEGHAPTEPQKEGTDKREGAVAAIPKEDPAFEEFEKRYLYTDSTEHLVQKLGVNWLSKDSIHFILISENDLCIYTLRGVAVKDYSIPNQEEAADVRQHPVKDYRVIDGEELSAIRIETTKKTMAQIRYTYSRYRDECDPEAAVVMKVIPADE